MGVAGINGVNGACRVSGSSRILDIGWGLSELVNIKGTVEMGRG